MQTWAKRGFQTALVTGGLLMLGTGIASADDVVNPDATPNSALDIKAVVPVKIQNNPIGVGGGRQVDAPAVNRTIAVSPRDVLKAAGVEKLVAPTVDGPSSKLLDNENGPLRGNKIVGTVIVPVDASGNAIGLLGDAKAVNDSTQSVTEDRPIVTDGSDHGLAGNVVDLDYTAPVQLTGNAVAVGGNADTENTASQTATAGGDTTTNGNHGALAGNVVAGHATTPVGVNGNAVGAIGNASAQSVTSSDSLAGGVIKTDGADSAVSGNAAGVPVSAPVRASGQAIGVLGNSETNSASTTTAQAGDQSPDFNGNPTYIHTNGADGATVAGTAAQPAISTPITADCGSIVGVGNADSLCTSDVSSNAGGGNRTFGNDSVLGGTIIGQSTGAPVSVIGAAGGAIGNATTDQTNTVNTGAGGANRTRGHDSVLGGTLVNSPVSSPVDACGTSAGAAVNSDVACSNTSTTGAGGDAGSTGDDSVGGGNGVTTPISNPVELVNNNIGGGGDSAIETSETKVSRAGGDANTADDDAVLGANLVQVPVAGPTQLFGNSAGVLANTDSATTLDNTVEAGGTSEASGTGGTGSGNIVQAPTTLPAQVFGAGGTVGGNGTANGSNLTSSSSGGSATTDGVDGNLAGNVVDAPLGNAAQVFGDSVAVLGDNDAAADNTTDLVAGGTTETSGKDGNISGNIVKPQALVPLQNGATAVSGVGGDNTATAGSTTTGAVGGDATTNGDKGFLAGNLFDVPAAALAPVHGDAVSAVGSDAQATSEHATSGSVGGTSTTSGKQGSLNGILLTAPTKVKAPVKDAEVELAGDADADADQTENVTVGEASNNVPDEDHLRLPTGGLGATELPKLPLLSTLPLQGGLPHFNGLPTGRSAYGADPLTGLLGGLPVSLPTAGLPTGAIGGLPLGGAAAARDLPVNGLGGTNLLGGLLGGGLPVSLPTAGLPTGAVGGLPLGGGRSMARELPTPAALPTTDDLTGSFSGNLFQAPALPVQTPALSTLDTPSASSLTDTRSKLAGLFGNLPIG
ncbi:hypothetical protein [Actinokineospora sp. NBRC 105648]|uniref:beta strand repeat-containing protein n=1 Tax=Actinokineospora sp. NBRC 105648 TaxID=3032206 RepID=UPI0024A1A87F|nr:hypothetical protein [Actinokineospora sp. NBRC 105648]GLZ37429.1 hypothetical protein Acsp05_10540 [Actinokineospora sp. NBRC 105648]